MLTTVETTGFALLLTVLLPATLQRQSSSPPAPATSQAPRASNVVAGAGLVSDDFSTAVLDTSVWTFIDPLDDAEYRFTGTQIEIGVSPAARHDAWQSGIEVPRISQPCFDADMQVDVKFDSPVTQAIQAQGLLFEQDDQNFVRIEHNFNSSARVLVATIINASGSVLTWPDSTVGIPIVLRVDRTGDDWTVSESADGVAFAPVHSFNQPIVLTSVSVYGGNPQFLGVPHIATADYFISQSDPITDDATPTELVVNTIGDGEVQRTPDQLRYGIGDMVSLLAVPDSGWSFFKWTGDASGNLNPLLVDVTEFTSITGVFVEPDDCNSNGVDDSEDITTGTSEDCNGNGIPDECDIADQTSVDADGNGIPDECETGDCDGDGIPDEQEPDCDNDGVPDDCESGPDCNGNGIPDDCDITDGTSQDCDGNTVPDECDPDCDGDGVPDGCESEPDCNGNNVPDDCDISGGTSQDTDGDGIPDECQIETYCRPKRNSAGCGPGIGFTGLPSLSGPDDFFVTASEVMGEGSGTLLWSLHSRAPLPRLRGASPNGVRLCFFGARAAGRQPTGGTLGACDGALAFHFSQADMISAGLTAGLTVYAQVVYEDPDHPDGSGLGHTAAIEFSILP